MSCKRPFYKIFLGQSSYFKKSNWGSSIPLWSFSYFRFFSNYIQSDNGKEFCAGVIKELVEIWPSIKIINRRPRHLQSQGLVERANGILQQKLGKWKENTGRNDWSFGLRFVILAMNNSWCQSHKKTLYELVFGCKPRGNCTLINDLYKKNIRDEEDIPDTIQIFDDCIENLNNDMADDLQGKKNSTIKSFVVLIINNM